MALCPDPNCGFDLATRPSAKFCPKCGIAVGSFKCHNCQQIHPPDLRDALEPEQCVKCAAAIRATEMRQQGTDCTGQLNDLRDAQKRGLAEIDALRADLARVQREVDTASQSKDAQEQQLRQALGIAARLEAKVAEVDSTKRQQERILSQLGLLEARLQQEQQRHKDVPDLSDDVEAVRKAQRDSSDDLRSLDRSLRERVAELDEQQKAVSTRLSDLGLSLHRVEQVQQTQQVRLKELDAIKSDHARRLAELEEVANQQKAKMAQLDRVKAMTVDHAAEAAKLRQQCQAELNDLALKQTHLLKELKASKDDQTAAVARVTALRREMEADAELQRTAREQLEVLNAEQESRLAELDTVTQQVTDRMGEVEQQQAEMRRLSNEVAAHIDAIKEAAEAASHARDEFEQVKDEWLKTFGMIQAAVQSGGGLTIGRPATDLISPQILQELASIRNPSPAFIGRVWSDREAVGSTARTREINVVPVDSKAVYRVGESVTLSFRCERDCYLSVIDIGTSGGIKVIFPNLWFPNSFLRAGESHVIPQAGYPFKFEVDGPRGIESVKAIFTLDPIDLADGGFSQQQPFRELSGAGATRDIRVLAAEVSQISHRITDLPADRWCESTCEFFVQT